MGENLKPARGRRGVKVIPKVLSEESGADETVEVSAPEIKSTASKVTRGRRGVSKNDDKKEDVEIKPTGRGRRGGKIAMDTVEKPELVSEDTKPTPKGRRGVKAIVNDIPSEIVEVDTAGTPAAKAKRRGVKARSKLTDVTPQSAQEEGEQPVVDPEPLVMEITSSEVDQGASTTKPASRSRRGVKAKVASTDSEVEKSEVGTPVVSKTSKRKGVKDKSTETEVNKPAIRGRRGARSVVEPEVPAEASALLLDEAADGTVPIKKNSRAKSKVIEEPEAIIEETIATPKATPGKRGRGKTAVEDTEPTPKKAKKGGKNASVVESPAKSPEPTPAKSRRGAKK